MKKLIVKTKGKTHCIAIDTILYCRASSAYTCIYLTNGDMITASFNLTALQAKLQVSDFMFRTGRSHLVNLSYLTSINHSRREIELGDEIKIPYTTTLREIEDLLKKLTQRTAG